jgi:hypothetical protein
VTYVYFWHRFEMGVIRCLLDSLAVWRVGCRSGKDHSLFFEVAGSALMSFSRRLSSQILSGGASVLVNGAVFKTGSETVRAGSGRFDSYTPPPKRLGIVDSGLPTLGINEFR